MINKPVVIKTENFSFVANLDWFSVGKKKKNKEILKKSKDLGLDFFVEKEINSEKVSFCVTSKETNNFVSGAYIVQGSKDFRNTVFFTLLDEFSTNNIFEQNKDLKKESSEYYWAVVFDKDGAVVPGYDSILTANEMEELLSNADFDSFNIVTTRGSIKDSEAEDSNIEVVSLNNIFSSTEEFIKRQLTIEKISITSTNKKMAPLFVFGGVMVAVVAYYLFGPMPMLDDLKNGVYSKNAAQIFSKTTKEIREVKTDSSTGNNRRGRGRNNTISKEEIILSGKKIISNNFNSAYYTNQDIFDNVSILKYHFNNNPVGWRKSDLLYEDNKFILKYNTNSISFKDFIYLDGFVKDEAKKLNLVVQPIGLNEEGKERVYEVIFPSEIKESVLKERQNNNKLISNIDEKRKELDSFERKIKGKMASIKNSISSVDNVNWFKLRFGNTIEGIISQIGKETREMKEIKKSIDLIIKDIKDLEESLKSVAIKEEWISGNVNDFIVTTQNEKMFQWSYPEDYTYIPPSKGRVAVNPYVKMYPFSVEPKNIITLYKKLQYESLGSDFTNDNIEVSNSDVEDKFDFRLFGVALSILDKSYILINKVELDYKNNNFNIEGEFYEKI